MKTNIVPMQIGQVIREIREARGATLEEIALAANTNASNLSRIERGKQGFSPDTLERIATALGVTVSELHLRLEASQAKALSGPGLGMPKGQEVESIFPASTYAALTKSNRELIDDFIALLLKRQKRGRV